MMVASTLALLSLVMPPVSIFSSASVALVTLRRGALEGLTILLCSSAAAGLLGFFLLGNFQFALLYVIVLWMPVWLISIVLREGRHLSLAVEIAVLTGMIGVIVFYLYHAEPAAMWKSILTQIVPANAPVENIQHTVDILSHYMTGIVAAGTVFGLLFGLFLGRWWQSVLYNPGGFRQEFLSLSTKPRLALGSIAVVAIAWASSGVTSEIFWNITILLFVLYTCIGTAVLHTVFASMKLARYMVPMFYLTLFLIPHAMLPVALIGLSDAWMDLRKKTNQTNA
ncbi:conserved membrane hypothetical protein [Candidatus Methylobacter favarea]|uniref:DUF2232 domain-containing protein n=2 Tax=Candidatus Methylobacter favarea TaxID=2707345 RepID=A0A8S0X7Z8_9GAMM|nr:conserved membrane hypothetical protein [Candidatus Methylobacter favarea]